MAETAKSIARKMSETNGVPILDEDGLERLAKVLSSLKKSPQANSCRNTKAKLTKLSNAARKIARIDLGPVLSWHLGKIEAAHADEPAWEGEVLDWLGRAAHMQALFEQALKRPLLEISDDVAKHVQTWPTERDEQIGRLKQLFKELYPSLAFGTAVSSERTGPGEEFIQRCFAVAGRSEITKLGIRSALKTSRQFPT